MERCRYDLPRPERRIAAKSAGPRSSCRSRSSVSELADDVEEKAMDAVTEIGQIVGIIREIIARPDLYVRAKVPIDREQCAEPCAL